MYSLSLLLPLGALLGYGAWTDSRRRVVPNYLALLTAISGLGLSAYYGGSELLLLHVAHGAAALVVGFALFAFNLWGGGDGKFYAAAACWFAISDFFRLVLFISIVGVLLILAMFVIRRGKLFRKDSAGIPYGVAIAGGAIGTFAWGVL